MNGVVRCNFQVRSETLYMFTPYMENRTVQCTVGQKAAEKYPLYKVRWGYPGFENLYGVEMTTLPS